MSPRPAAGSRARWRGRRVLVAAPAFAPWDLGTYLRRLLAARGVRVETCAYREASTDAEASAGLLAAARRFAPDVVLGLKLGRIAPAALREVRARGALVALWYVDCFDGTVPPAVARLLPEVDVFLTTAGGMVPRYRAVAGTPVHWLMEGAFLPAFRPAAVPRAQRATYASDVAFIGNVLHPPVADEGLALRRFRLLAAVARRFALKVWGVQGDPGTRARWAGVPAPLIDWPAFHGEVVRICRSARIVLGVNTVNDVERYFSNRTFLTLAAGGFHLTHYVPGLETMFDNHRHLVWFHSDEECLDLVAHYLPRAAARRRIAEAGRAWTRRRYGMGRQVGRLLDILDAHRGGRAP